MIFMRKESIKDYPLRKSLLKVNVIKLIMLEFKSDDISADILF